MIKWYIFAEGTYDNDKIQHILECKYQLIHGRDYLLCRNPEGKDSFKKRINAFLESNPKFKHNNIIVVTDYDDGSGHIEKIINKSKEIKIIVMKNDFEEVITGVQKKYSLKEKKEIHNKFLEDNKIVLNCEKISGHDWLAEFTK